MQAIYKKQNFDGRAVTARRDIPQSVYKAYPIKNHLDGFIYKHRYI